MNSRTTAQKVAHLVLTLLCTVLGTGVFAAAVTQKQESHPKITFIAEPAAVASVTEKAIEKPAVVKGDSELMYTTVSKGFAAPAKLPAPAKVASAKPMSPSNGRIVWMQVTAYCPCKKCCGRNARGVTASGKRVSYNGGKFVAADTNHFPFGTRLSIPGYHNAKPVEVIDTGSAIKGKKLDVYFSSHETAMEWGVRSVPVTVFDEE